MAKYLVTGGAGFIGGHIVEELVRRGHQVRVLDNFSSGKDENLAGFNGEVELIKGDVCDSDGVVRAVRGMDGVFHQAAVASVPRSIREPIRTNESNIDGTLNL